jgi:hypothetical protein
MNIRHEGYAADSFRQTQTTGSSEQPSALKTSGRKRNMRYLKLNKNLNDAE